VYFLSLPTAQQLSQTFLVDSGFLWDKYAVHWEIIKESSCTLEEGLLYIPEIAKILF
jgi:hypothetical protein